MIPGYRLVLTDTMDTLKYCRLVVLVKEEINFNVEKELMDKTSATIWISIPRKGQKKVIIGAIYREQHLIRVEAPNNTDDPREQEGRWKIILAQWKKASRGMSASLWVT